MLGTGYTRIDYQRIETKIYGGADHKFKQIKSVAVGGDWIAKIKNAVHGGQQIKAGRDWDWEEEIKTDR